MILNNIRLLVSKFDETFLFYRDILNFKVTWGNLGENYAQFQTSESTALAIFSKSIMSRVLGINHLPEKLNSQDNVILVFTTNNVDEIYYDLRKKDVAFITPPTDQPDWGIRVAHLRDPEGNLLEFASELPIEKYSDNLRKEITKKVTQ
jgi:lactoylglutathione lyase